MTIRSSLEHATVDAMQNGMAFGEVASAMQVPGVLSNIQNTRSVVGNATVLPYDSWKDIEQAAIAELKLRTVGVKDLMERGLVKRTSGFGATVLQWQTLSDMESAEVAMDPISRGQRDLLNSPFI